ncbi:MAG: hypothetical protein RIF44_22380 [Nitratireductor sp.]
MRKTFSALILAAIAAIPVAAIADECALSATWQNDGDPSYSGKMASKIMRDR